MPLRLRRGTEADRTSITPVQGEPIYTTDTKKFYIGDGVTAGGVEFGVPGTSGTSGTSGAAGNPGSSGTSGTAGTSGTPGSSGTSGTAGTSGTPGSSGTSGTAGTSGTPGSSGTSGTAGTSGTPGSSGTSGTPGSSGTSGTGTPGSSGTSGTSGTVTLSGTTDNGVITLNGSSPNATVESNLTFNGSLLSVIGSINLTNPGELQTPIIVGYAEKLQSLSVSANGGGVGSITLNLSNYNQFRLTLDGNVNVLNISNPPASSNAGSFTLVLTGDGTARSFTWPASVNWINGTPAVPSTNGNSSVYTFVTWDGGVDFLGLVIAEDIADL